MAETAWVYSASGALVGKLVLTPSRSSSGVHITSGPSARTIQLTPSEVLLGEVVVPVLVVPNGQVVEMAGVDGFEPVTRR